MPWKVLLADDDVPVLSTLKSVFETREFAVSMASSASEALRRMDEARFDLVVTDMRMEQSTSGYDVVQGAKRQDHRPVVVILSAFPIPAPEWRASGADGMFLKGSSIGRMLDDIERLLRYRKRDQTTERSNAERTNQRAG